MAEESAILWGCARCSCGVWATQGSGVNVSRRIRRATERRVCKRRERGDKRQRPSPPLSPSVAVPPSAAVWSMPLCRVLWFFSINYLRKKK